MVIRYPGSKAKFWPLMFDYFPDVARTQAGLDSLKPFCEPFCGTAAIGWQIIDELPSDPCRRVILNDLDPGIAALWLAVRDSPRELVKHVYNFQPSPEAFYEYKSLDGQPCADPVLRAFRKLVLHQTSFSGLGFMAGGPLGGRQQQSRYNVGCRWNKARIADKIVECNGIMRRHRHVEITSQDFAAVLSRLPDESFAYLDPPYFEQGQNLYKFSFTEEDHARLAALLKGARYSWALSYDDHPRIRELYSWASVKGFEMTPTVQTARTTTRRKNREVVITPPQAA
jgi:DNA adenine methylase